MEKFFTELSIDNNYIRRKLPFAKLMKISFVIEKLVKRKIAIN